MTDTDEWDGTPIPTLYDSPLMKAFAAQTMLRLTLDCVAKEREQAASVKERAARTPTPDGLPSTLPLGLSLRLAAKVVGVSPNTFRRLERDKLMPSRKLVGGRRLYDRDDLLLAFRRAPTIDGGPGMPPPALIDPAEDHSWDDLK